MFNEDLSLAAARSISDGDEELDRNSVSGLLFNVPVTTVTPPALLLVAADREVLTLVGSAVRIVRVVRRDAGRVLGPAQEVDAS